jgi:hypothetical protein
VARPWARKFLGYSFTTQRDSRLKVARESVQRLPLLRGWVNYFRLAEVKGILKELDSWIRRKLRGLIWRADGSGLSPARRS